MDITTALRRRDSAIIQLRDAMSAASIFGQTHVDLLDKISTIRATTLKGCPRWAKSEFEGYHRALSDALYQTKLVFGGFVEGKFYSTHRDRPDYYEINGISPADYADEGRVKQRGHYWATTQEPCPFHVG